MCKLNAITCNQKGKIWGISQPFSSETAVSTMITIANHFISGFTEKTLTYTYFTKVIIVTFSLVHWKYSDMPFWSREIDCMVFYVIFGRQSWELTTQKDVSIPHLHHANDIILYRGFF